MLRASVLVAVAPRSLADNPEGLSLGRYRARGSGLERSAASGGPGFGPWLDPSSTTGLGDGLEPKRVISRCRPGGVRRKVHLDLTPRRRESSKASPFAGEMRSLLFSNG